LEHDKNRYDWQGAQIPLIGFDELTHFSEAQFFYMMGRNRSMSGVPAYVRATCNPDPDSFVAKLVEWYVSEDGFPIPERSGRLRWFCRVNDELFWADTRAELVDRFGADTEPKSFTFIAADVYDNPALLKRDPGYLANLKAQSHVDRMRLLHGNWKVRSTAGSYFKRADFKFVDIAPAGIPTVRYWDRAATEKRSDNDPDWTVGVKVGRDSDGKFYVLDVQRLQAAPFGVQRAIETTAELDGRKTDIWLEQSPAGEFEIAHYIRALAAYGVKAEKPCRDKPTRAKPASSQVGAGNVYLVRAPWNEAFLLELENFDKGKHDDQVDAFAGAVNALAGDATIWKPEGVVMQPSELRHRPTFRPRRL
jgi:predicted phage terminase large subunit-like protein